MFQRNPTGLFVPFEKKHLCYIAFEKVLHDRFQLTPVLVLASDSSTCEIFLTYIKKYGPSALFLNFNAAKKFVEKHLHIVLGETNTMWNKSKPSRAVTHLDGVDDDIISVCSMSDSIVDLTSDNKSLESEPEVIELDDSVNQLNRSIGNLELSCTRPETISLDKVPRLYARRSPRLVERARQSVDSDIQVVKVVRNNMTPCSSYLKKDELARIKSSTCCSQTSPSSFVTSSNESISPHGVPSEVVTSNRRSRRVKRRLTQTPTDSSLSEALTSPRRSRPTHLSGPSSAKVKTNRKRKRLHDDSPKTYKPTRNSPRQKPLSDGVLKYYTDVGRSIAKFEDRPSQYQSSSHNGLLSRLKNMSKNKTPIRNNRSTKKKKGQKVGSSNKSSRLFPYSNAAGPSTSPRKRKSTRKSGISTGSNVFNPNPQVDMRGLRPVAIDGSNIAIGHGKGKFSTRGIQICVEYFIGQGHEQVKVFLPLHRQKFFSESLLEELKSKCDVVFTPSREINGRMLTCYDDRFIIQYAVEFGGVIVSTDNFRDLIKENPKWKIAIEQRLLMFTWIDDFLMFPRDPLGQYGPRLEEFLKF